MIRRKNHGRNHSYVNDKGELVPQVSGIVKKGVDKSGPLTAWVARITADYVVDHWDDLAAMPISERYWTVRKVAESARNSAAAKGTKFHVLVDKLSSGESAEYDPAMAGSYSALSPDESLSTNTWNLVPLAAAEFRADSATFRTVQYRSEIGMAARSSQWSTT